MDAKTSYYYRIITDYDTATRYGIRTRHADKWPSAVKAAREMYNKIRKAKGMPIIDETKVYIECQNVPAGAFTAATWTKVSMFNWQGLKAAP